MNKKNMTWFEKSKSFEKIAGNALKMELYDITCFSCQQAVELYLKGNDNR
ncbi:MAG: HEPN domain-containing protein [Methanophagales archaeon]|nr:HEPN domain-containing protein [Methanophagales archaeon]